MEEGAGIDVHHATVPGQVASFAPPGLEAHGGCLSKKVKREPLGSLFAQASLRNQARRWTLVPLWLAWSRHLTMIWSMFTWSGSARDQRMHSATSLASSGSTPL